MRWWLVAPAALGLGACITFTIPVGHVEVHKTDAVVVASAGIHTALASIRKDLPKIEAGLTPLRCGGVKCYSSAQVESALDVVWERVHSAIPHAAKPLRLALDEELSAAAKLGRPVSLQPIQPAQLRADAATTGYETDQVHGVFANIAAALESLLAHKDLAPSLYIRSQPAGAAVYIQVADNTDTRLDVTTDNQLQHVWRGRYSGLARKSGYRDAPLNADLMRESRTRVLCTLYPLSADASLQSSCGFEPR